MRLFFNIAATLLLSCPVFAQQQFITQGKIEYERKTNQHAFMEDGNI